MVVASNTSPITKLAAVGQLNKLRDLYGQIVIPQAVFDDLVLIGIAKGIPAMGTEHEVFLKTIIPSRKATRQYLRGTNED